MVGHYLGAHTGALNSMTPTPTTVKETWGPAALYVAPDDHAGLEAALRRLINDPLDRLRRGEAALARALQLTPERMADSYVAAYTMLNPSFASQPVKELQCA